MGRKKEKGKRKKGHGALCQGMAMIRQFGEAKQRVVASCIHILGLFVVLFLVGVGEARAASYHVIVCGQGGTDLYVAQFDNWGKRLRSVLVDQMGLADHRVYLLTELGKDANDISELDKIKKVFGRIGQDASAQDDVFVYLIGHGSYRRNIAKLNIPGSDLTAMHLDEWMRSWSVRRVVVVNSASSSAAFVNVLSGKGRIVCTSTRSAEERNATRFMEFFVQALEDGSADQNRDERISVLEVCRQAASLTDTWYSGEGYLATEHALLEDNGDGKGTRLTELASVLEDGKEADQVFILDMPVPEGTPVALVDAYQAAIASVQALIKKKQDLEAVAYYEELERQLLKAAQLNRQIRKKGNSEDL